MNVTIIGAGNMARGIGMRLAQGGHNITVHAQESAKGDALCKELQGVAAPGATVNVGQIGDELSPVVVLAVPYGVAQDVVAAYQSFDAKIVVDITNPVDFNTFQLIPAAGTSGSEAIAASTPGAKIVKAFNTIFAGTLVTGSVDGKELDVLIAGDDAEAKSTVKELVQSSGMRGIDVGPLAHARHLEGLALMHMSVQDQLQTNWMSAVKFLG